MLFRSVVDQSILLLSPCTHHRLTCHYTALLFFGMRMLYGVSKYSNNEYKTCLFIFMMIFSAILAYWVVSIITHYIYVEPLCSQFQEEGLPLKNMTVLKSGGSVPMQFNIHIIQYEVDMIDSTRTSSIVKVQARTFEKNLESLRVLPLQPTSICAPGLPGISTGSMYVLLASPLGFISFYDWNESDNLHEKCMFALVTAILCILGALCVAIGNLDILDTMTGKSKDTVIVSDGNKLT